MEEHRSINAEYAEIAKDLIEKESLLVDILHSDVTIIYLSSDKEKKSKGKLVLGECEKINPKYKWAIPCDFTITLYEPNIVNLSKDQLQILIFHELLHVGIEEKNGDIHYSVRPHDIEDFRTIIDRFGLDWNIPEWEALEDGYEEDGADGEEN